MPRIPVHSVDSAPEASRATLKALEARVGKVLNTHGAMADSPAVLNASAALNQAVDEHSSLDPCTRAGDVSGETWQAALDADWTERQLADAFASVAANLFTDFFNHDVRTELDLPAAPALS